MNTFRLLAAVFGLAPLILAGLAATVSPAHAYGLTPAGPEFQVHTTAVGAQGGPAIAMDASGNSMIAWGSGTYSLVTSGLYGQRFDSAGTPVGPEFKISEYAGATGAAVAMSPSGEFIVAWNPSFGFDGMILAKRFDAAGNSLPPSPTVPGVPWDLPNAFFVKTITPATGSLISESRPVVAVEASGAFVVAWENRTAQDGSDYGIFARRYDSAGNEIPPPPAVQGAGAGNEFQVNSFTSGIQTVPDIAIGPGGSFIIAWWSFQQDSGFDGVFAKRYDSAGNELAPPSAS